MQTLFFVQAFLVFLSLMKLILFGWIVLKLPKELKLYSFIQRLKMLIPFGIGKRIIRAEHWEALRWHQFRCEVLVYLISAQFLIWYVWIKVAQSEWIKTLQHEKF